MTFHCVEICKHTHKDEREETRCRSTHKSPEAAEKHARSHFAPYFASNQPWDQEKIEIRDEAGKVHITLVHQTTIGRSTYARWARQALAQPVGV